MMDGQGWAAFYALFVWWFSTGVILFAIGLARWTRAWTLWTATLAALLALMALVEVRDETTVASAIIAFTASIVLWGWQEVLFLTGVVTGPRRTTCPPGARGWQRFRMALAALLHHELGLLATGFVIAILSVEAANVFALWTWGVLWIARISAKLNIFLGVPNLTVEFVPDALAHLKSYFAVKPMNALFPVSVTINSLAAAWLTHSAFAAGVSPHAATGYTLVAVLTALAAIEHWFLVLPIPDAVLWRKAFRAGDAARPAGKPGLNGPVPAPGACD